MRGRKALASLALVLAAGSLSACAEYTTTGVPQEEPTLDAIGASLAPTADGLNGSNWTLSSSTAEGVDLSKFAITANFADGMLSGKAAVNRYSTSYEIPEGVGDEGAVEFGPIVTTKMAGTKEQMAAETAYLTLLGSVTEFHRDGEHLSLLAGEKPVLEFAEKDDTALALAATTAFGRTLIGQTVEQANINAQQAGYTLRVISEDGVDKPATTDLVLTRVNATVVDGVITEVTAG